MLIVFKSKAAAEIVMYKKHVQELFTFLEKDIDRGVITALETEEIIKKIEEFIQNHQKEHEDLSAKNEDDIDEFEKYKLRQEVSLSARLYPLLEMLHEAHKKQKDILWGV